MDGLPRVARFERVSFAQFEKDLLKQFPGMAGETVRAAYEGIRLPRRATVGSSGYDLRTPIGFSLRPGEDIVIPTGLRAWIAPGWWLMLMPRSGLGFRLYTRLANTVGNIDSDYYTADNEGHIMVKLRLELLTAQVAPAAQVAPTTTAAPDSHGFPAGTAVCQGVFVPYGVTVDDDASDQRTGGFGSTGR